MMRLAGETKGLIVQIIMIINIILSHMSIAVGSIVLGYAELG